MKLQRKKVLKESACKCFLRILLLLSIEFFMKNPFRITVPDEFDNGNKVRRKIVFTTSEASDEILDLNDRREMRRNNTKTEQMKKMTQSRITREKSMILILSIIIFMFALANIPSAIVRIISYNDHKGCSFDVSKDYQKLMCTLQTGSPITISDEEKCYFDSLERFLKVQNETNYLNPNNLAPCTRFFNNKEMLIL